MPPGLELLELLWITWVLGSKGFGHWKSVLHCILHRLVRRATRGTLYRGAPIDGQPWWNAFHRTCGCGTTLYMTLPPWTALNSSRNVKKNWKASLRTSFVFRLAAGPGKKFDTWQSSSLKAGRTTRLIIGNVFSLLLSVNVIFFNALMKTVAPRSLWNGLSNMSFTNQSLWEQYKWTTSEQPFKIYTGYAYHASICKRIMCVKQKLQSLSPWANWVKANSKQFSEVRNDEKRWETTFEEFRWTCWSYTLLYTLC